MHDGAPSIGIEALIEQSLEIFRARGINLIMARPYHSILFAWIDCDAGFASLFQMDGLQYTSVATSAFLTQLYCVLIPFYKTLRHRRIPGPRILLAVALGVAGFAVFSGVSADSLVPSAPPLGPVAGDSVTVTPTASLPRSRPTVRRIRWWRR